MQAEQVIRILRACGWIFLLPTIVCLIGSIWSLRRLRLEPEQEVPEETAKTDVQVLPAQKTKPAKKARRKKRREEGAEAPPGPSVASYVPEDARAILEDLCAGFPLMSERWKYHYRKEEK